MLTEAELGLPGCKALCFLIKKIIGMGFIEGKDFTHHKLSWWKHFMFLDMLSFLSLGPVH